MRIRRLSTVLAGIAGLALVAGCGSDDRDAAGGSAALAVATEVLVTEDGYTALIRYAGRVEAGRRSQLGFELGGEIAAIAVDDGDPVGAGDVLARLDTARLRAQRAEAAAAVAAAAADAELAAATLARVREARSYDGVSPLELDQAEQRAAAADAARAAAAAVVERIDVELDKSTLRAPYAGTVVARWSVDEGQIVAQGQPVVDLQESA
ncbi:MAG: efflux RND transporter periplasmic adaptor subunit, partial [Pseudomonadota bacterium]